MDMLECNVCNERYDLKERTPKALRCVHTFCEFCVERLTKDTKITCPTCRRECKTFDIRTNFALSDVLETLCEICVDKKKDKKCHHCDKILCSSCLQAHGREYHSFIKKSLNKLQNSIKMALEMSMDESVINKERKFEVDAIDAIKAAVNDRRAILDKAELELIKQVRTLKEVNVNDQLGWTWSVGEVVFEASEFVQKTNNDLGQSYVDAGTEIFHAIDKEVVRKSGRLLDIVQRQPNRIGYEFIPMKAITETIIGKIAVIVDEPQTEETTACCDAQQNRTENESKFVNTPTIARSESSLSVNMSPMETNTPSRNYQKMVLTYKTYESSDDLQLSNPRHVLCTKERIFVTDAKNHRISVYNLKLEVKYSFGSRGKQEGCLSYPSGIGIDVVGNLYISEEGNHRIKVCTQSGNFTKHISCERSNPKRLKHPLGLFNTNDELFICDQDNLRIQVLRLDGTHKYNIETKSKPVDVTNVGDKVVVVEQDSNQLNVYTKGGDHIESWPKTIPAYVTLGRAPGGVCTDGHGHVIVPYIGGRLVVLTDQGQYVCTFPDEKWEFSGRAGVCVSSCGEVVVCDSNSNYVCIYGTKN